jgi:hypothetical protein
LCGSKWKADHRPKGRGPARDKLRLSNSFHRDLLNFHGVQPPHSLIEMLVPRKFNPGFLAGAIGVYLNFFPLSFFAALLFFFPFPSFFPIFLNHRKALHHNFLFFRYKEKPTVFHKLTFIQKFFLFFSFSKAIPSSLRFFELFEIV